MSYDGFYSGLSSRGTTNEVLTQVLTAKEEALAATDRAELAANSAELSATTVETRVQDAEGAAASASQSAANALTAVTSAEVSANSASSSAQIAATSQSAANQSAIAADVAATRAETAQNEVDNSAGIVKTTADGIATGKQFFSTLSPDNKEDLIRWENVSGVAVDTGKRTPSASAIPSIGVEGSYNLVAPTAKKTSNFGINSSSNYGELSTAKSIAIRVDEGAKIVISNPAGNYLASDGYGAAFFSDLPTAANKVSAFSGTKLTNLAGLTYLADTVPAGAKYLVLNTEFRDAQHNWFAAYDTGFSGAVDYNPVVARINDLRIYDRDLDRKLAAAFSAVEGNDNLYIPSGLLVGNINATGEIQRTNAVWRYTRVPVVEGLTYAIYSGSNAWGFPVAGSYGVAGADPAASGAKATLNPTTDEFVRIFTVPTGQGITHFFFNVVITPPGGSIDFSAALIIREGSSVPVRVLPYEPVMVKVNGFPVKDSKAREGLLSVTSAFSQTTGRYNLLDPQAPTTANYGITGTSNYGYLAQSRSVVIPVIEGMPIVAYNVAGIYTASTGRGVAFFSGPPTAANRVAVFNTAVRTNSDGLRYLADTVPVGAKYLVLNTEFRGVQFGWFIAYDTGFSGVVPFKPTISELNGVPITDRDTLIQLNELGRIVPKRFANKKIFYFGDSITAGGNGGFPSYTGLVTDILKCVSTNYGSSGAKTDRLVGIMTNLDPRDGTAKTVTPDYTDVTAVTIMIGSNDAGTTGAGVNGSLADIPTERIQDLPFTTAGGVSVTTPDEYWSLFPNTYYGNLSLCIEYVKWKNPSTVIYLISATQRGATSAPMDAVIAAKTAIARFYSIQFLNATHECGIDLKGLATYSHDMLHPNALGVERLGKYVGYKILHS